MKKTFWLTVWLLLFGLVINFDKTFMALTVQFLQTQAGWTASQSGDLLAVVYGAFLLATLPSGWLIERFHYRRYVRVNLIILAVASLLFFFATRNPLTLTPWALMSLRFLTGLGYAGFTSGVPKIIQENYPQQKKGDIQGYVIGTIGAGAIVSFTLGTALSSFWQFMYLGLALGFVLLWMAAARLPKPQPVAPSKERDWRVLLAWKDRNTLILTVLMIVIEMVCIALMNWLPTLWGHKFAVSASDMTWVLMGYALVMSIGVSTVASLRRKFFMGREGLFIVVCSLISAALLLLVENSSSMFVVGLGIYSASLLLTWAFGLIWVLPYDYVKPDMLACSFAVINVGSFVGGILQGSLIGRIVDAAGGSFTAAIFFMAALLLAVSPLPSLLRK